MVLRPKARESGSPPGPTGAPDTRGRRQATVTEARRHDHTRRTDAPREPQAGDRGEDAGWSSPVARQAHNLKVAGSNPAPATNVTTVRPSPSPRAPIRPSFGRRSSQMNIEQAGGPQPPPPSPQSRTDAPQEVPGPEPRAGRARGDAAASHGHAEPPHA